MAAVILISAWAVLVSFGSPFLAVLAIAILLVSVAPFWLPTHYVLDDQGIEERRWPRRKFRKWSDLRRVQVGARAALVSPFSRPHWMDRHRGVVVFFDGAERELVISLLRERTRPDGAASAAPGKVP